MIVIKKIETENTGKSKFACIWAEQQLTLELGEGLTERDCLNYLLKIEEEIKVKFN